MSRKMERDVYNIARSILAGYDRRKKEYLATLEELRDPLKAMRYDTVAVSSAAELSQPENATDRILEYEKSFNARAVGAVEQARANLIFEYGDSEAALTYKAFTFNAENPHLYSFRVLKRILDLPYELSTFKRYREVFYGDIIDSMENY